LFRKNLQKKRFRVDDFNCPEPLISEIQQKKISFYIQQFFDYGIIFLRAFNPVNLKNQCWGVRFWRLLSWEWVIPSHYYTYVYKEIKWQKTWTFNLKKVCYTFLATFPRNKNARKCLCSEFNFFEFDSIPDNKNNLNCS
jgi:hypothetical protein